MKRQDAIKYPWLPAARDFFPQELSQDIRTWVASIPSKHPGLYHLAYHLFDSAVQRVEVIPDFRPNPHYLMLYPFVRLFLALFGNSQLTFQVANTYSKTTNDMLNRERESDILRISNYLGWQVEERGRIVNARKYHFRIRVFDYVRYSVLMRDPNWKLTNKYLEGGYVLLEKAGLARLLEEHVKWEIINTKNIEADGLSDLLRQEPGFEEFWHEVEELIREKQVRFSTKLDLEGFSDKHALFPPCVKVLYQKVTRGQNLGHLERLFFAFFMLNMEYTVDDVVDLFRNSPDFDEKIARYQIEHAAGMRGKGTKYKAHGCSKLKSFGLCYAKDEQFGHELCASGKVNHPVSFVKKVLWLMRKKGVGKKNTTGPTSNQGEACGKGGGA
ncbi:MAG: hypothetical protein ACTSU5_13960 [Promethearchaeota archaeon]